VEIEVKSFNSRFLDLSVKLPKEISQYEFEIRNLIKERLKRGKISVNINLTANTTEKELISIDQNALKSIISSLEEIKQHSNYSGDLTMDNMLVLKDFFVKEYESDLDLKWENFKDSIIKATDDLIEMRSKEGIELKNDIEFRVKSIDAALTRIENLAKNSTAEYFEKFRDKAKKLYDEFIDDEDRFLIELGILSEKHDVTEECIRLRSHIKLFHETLENAADIGRKLNFICQEMNREVNTINSKSVSSEISHLGIRIKEELEKIREQVQNIE
jgi:uncharacterized protein (TIGR00255 family)